MAAARSASVTGDPDPFTPLEIASLLRDAFTGSCWPAAAPDGRIAAARSPRLRQLALVLVERLGVDVAAGHYTWPELVNVLLGAAITIQMLQCNPEPAEVCEA